MKERQNVISFFASPFPSVESLHKKGVLLIGLSDVLIRIHIFCHYNTREESCTKKDRIVSYLAHMTPLDRYYNDKNHPSLLHVHLLSR